MPPQVGSALGQGGCSCEASRNGFSHTVFCFASCLCRSDVWGTQAVSKSTASWPSTKAAMPKVRHGSLQKF